MFSVVSVCPWGVWWTCNHYPWCIKPHHTGTPQPHPCTTDIWGPRWETCSNWFTSGNDIWWPRPEACTNLFTWGPPPSPPHIHLGLVAGTVSDMHPMECLLVAKCRDKVEWRQYRISELFAAHYAVTLALKYSTDDIPVDSRLQTLEK